MDNSRLKKEQTLDRDRILRSILNSKSKKKIIVAGAGTGKSHAFFQLLSLKTQGSNLALTFIKKLKEDMESSLSKMAEVKTFHSYCKGKLHIGKGKFLLTEHLTYIIEKDAKLLGHDDLAKFDEKFRVLEEDSPEISFYLERGDYYRSVSFNDSVFRLLQIVRSDASILPDLAQIVIDEFQDFNPLEVALIDELEKKGEILIVGDDDQAIYDDRSASPDFLRRKYFSGEYEPFILPYCNRCTKVIVDATNSIISKAESIGNFSGRIPKTYECFFPKKEGDSKKFPKIDAVRLSNIAAVTKYIKREITKIHAVDILDSYKEGYPTVLIIGQRQYLAQISKSLKAIYLSVQYENKKVQDFGIWHGYELLVDDKFSNLGWRMVIDQMLDEDSQKKIIAQAKDGTFIYSLLGKDFLELNLKVVDIVQEYRKKVLNEVDFKKKLVGLLPKEHAMGVQKFFVEDSILDPIKINEKEPSILLCSYKGAKGLSGGHVFIVGLNNGSLPINPKEITDVEISKFIVALTRTRKKCHLISNKWLFGPKIRDKFISPPNRSVFIEWIPSKMVNDLGDLKASEIT